MCIYIFIYFFYMLQNEIHKDSLLGPYNFWHAEDGMWALAYSFIVGHRTRVYLFSRGTYN